jgi:predicted ABC-type transport system involved in lysophospholipase L1 biosynthesis ATPase subunit
MNAPPLPSAAIEATALTKVYGHGRTEVTALRGVDLRVEHGEVVALLGPSGAGKSTLLTAIGLINPPTSGRILIEGTLVLDGPRAQVDLRAFRRQHLGFVFQKANLIPFLSALPERGGRARDQRRRPPVAARAPRPGTARLSRRSPNARGNLP